MELREFLFEPLRGRSFGFAVRAKENGIFSGAAKLKELAEHLNIRTISLAQEGETLSPGTIVLQGLGGAEEVARAEETLLGVISKASGVASAASAMVAKASPVRVVCGAWKKVSSSVRAELRQAVTTGGCGLRIADEPFIYLDKNYIRMFGGIAGAVSRAKRFEPERLVVAQLRGEETKIADEAREAWQAGAAILMVDTGCLEDLRATVRAAASGGWRQQVQLAFAGGVTGQELEEVKVLGIDVVDVGRAILDAPMLDFSLDVEG